MGHLIAFIIAAFAPQDSGDVVRVSLRGGAEVQGYLIGIDEGVYRVRAGNEERRLDAKDVLSVVVVSRGAPPTPPPGAPPVALDRIRALVEDSKFDDAFKEVDDLLKILGGQRTDIEAMLRKALPQTMAAHLSARRPAEAVEAFRRTTQWLNEVDTGNAFATLCETLKTAVDERPAEAFTRDLTLALAAEVVKNPKLGEGYRRRAYGLVTTLADALRDRRAFQDEATVSAAAADLFEESRKPLIARRLRARLDYAETCLDDKRPDDAVHETTQVLADAPANARAGEILERARFQSVLAAYPKLPYVEALRLLRAYLAERPTPPRVEVIRLREAEVVRDRLGSATREEARALLDEYLQQELPADLLEWGRDQLAKLQSPAPGGGQDIEVFVEVNDDGPTPDIARYFPFGKGTRFAYRRSDGTQITITHDAVVRDGDAHKIDYSLEERAGENRVRHSFQSFVGPAEAYTETRGHKEVLLRVPAAVGDSWTWSIGDATYVRRVVAVDSTERVGSAQYDHCIMVEFTTTIAAGSQTVTITSRSSYAPGVGLVRMDFVEPAYQKYSLELVSYSEATK